MTKVVANHERPDYRTMYHALVKDTNKEIAELTFKLISSNPDDWGRHAKFKIAELEKVINDVRVCHMCDTTIIKTADMRKTIKYLKDSLNAECITNEQLRLQLLTITAMKTPNKGV